MNEERTGRIPQPGERWRIRIRDVEYECPACHAPIAVGSDANDGLVVTVLPPQQDTCQHVRRGCFAIIPVPWGWVWYRTHDGDRTRYVLPYTMFEPLAEPLARRET